MTAGAAVTVDVRPGISLWRVFRRNRAALAGAVVLTLLLVLALVGRVSVPFDPYATSAGPVMAPPGAVNWAGTDALGRDVLSRTCFGLGTSLIVGLSAAGLATILAVAVGASAGFFGRRVDDTLMRCTEVFQVIPRFFLAVLLVAFFGASLMNVILAIGILSWPENARVVRAEVMALKHRQYVAAARVAGAGTAAVIFLEILPNAMGPVIVTATLLVGQAILLEAGLSYLGLGDPSQVSLGLMLYEAQEIMRTAWWSTAFPGAMLFLAVLSVNVVGDGLNDVLNPQARGR